MTSGGPFARARTFVGLGLSASVLSVTGFWFSVVHQIHGQALYLLSAFPAVAGISAFALAIFRSRAPTTVQYLDEGLRLDFLGGESRTIPWDAIVHVMLRIAPVSHQRYLGLYDRQGKELARIATAVHGFDQLARRIEQRVSRNDRAAAAMVGRQKGRRQALQLIGMGVFLGAMSAGAMSMAHRQQRDDELLHDHGVTGQGQIQRRFLAPDGVTPRLEYRVVSSSGLSAVHNAHVRRAVWDQLADNGAIEILYVPERPEITSLSYGEIPEERLRVSLILMLSFFAVGITAIGVVSLLGWDIVIEQGTGKLRIKRHGT
jgi:hypothetical protein